MHFFDAGLGFFNHRLNFFNRFLNIGQLRIFCRFHRLYIIQTFLKILIAGYKGQHSGNPQQNNAQIMEHITDQNHRQRRHLKTGFPFGQTCYRHTDMNFRQKLAQTGNQNFAAENDDDRNKVHRMNHIVRQNNNQSRSHQQLVGNRIQQPPECGSLVAGTRQITVKIIGN